MRKTIDGVNHSGEAGPAAGDVFEAIHAVMHRYRAGLHRTSRAGTHGLTHMDGKVLGFYARRPGATQKDLVEHSGRDKGQLARLIAGLRERGLLDARIDEADRRNLRLELTAEGRKAQQALRRQAEALARLGVAGLAATERQHLVELLGAVLKNLDAAG